MYFFLNRSPSPLSWKKNVVSTLEKPQRSISLNLYCATWNSHFDFHCLKDKMHMRIFSFIIFEKACTEKQTVLSLFFCLQRPTEKFLWRNVESTICNTLQWWCHNKGTCTGRGGVEINGFKFSYICLYVCFTSALVLKPLWSIFIYLVCKQPGVWSVNIQHKKLTVFVSLNNPLLQAVLTKGYCEWMGFCFGHQPPNSLLQFSHWKGDY